MAEWNVLYYKVSRAAWEGLLALYPDLLEGHDLGDNFKLEHDSDQNSWFAKLTEIDEEEFEWLEDNGIILEAVAFRASNQPSYLGV